MPKYTLTYFNIRARAEISRLIFAAAGQEYEDRRIQESTEPDFQKVFQMKEEDRKYFEEWLKEKAKTPFGQVPTLEVDGQTIVQSKVIATFLARRFGLAGKTDLEDAKAAMIAETAEESLMNAVFGIFGEKDEEKKKERVKKYVSETLPNLLTNFEKQVGEKGHFVGDQLTYADIAFYHNSTYPSFLQVEIDWAKYPKLKAVCDHVTSNPGIAKWLKERPQTPF